LTFPPIFEAISDKIPLHAKAMPDHPVKESECPFKKILNRTEKILRVVVTVDKISGSTLAKSGKMAPSMLGQLILGGASYTVREYLQVAAIIGGTAVVSMGKKKGSSSASSTMGVAYIVLSLVLDGVTAGFQKQLKEETKKAGVKPKPYDFMFWTNFYMCLTAIVISAALNEIGPGLAYCTDNPEIFSKIVKFAVCSAVGQSFIFYTIANFDPLILSTVTTTRKIFSVLLSIFLKGHSLSLTGWSGIALACSGILSEMASKMGGKVKAH
jgi:UDP-galactose transporter B1